MSYSPETLEQRKARQYATLRSLGELANELALVAHASAKRQIATPPAARPKDAPDYAVTFASMFRAIRQAIALELRLDAPARTRPSFRLGRLQDPRRPLLRRVFLDAVRGDPERRREITPAIDHLLDADPDQQTPIAETIATLCNALCIDLDLARVPDEFLDLAIPPRTTSPPSQADP